MRHVYIRGFLGLIWFAAAILSGSSHNLKIAGLYAILSCSFFYSASITWKKVKNKNGGCRRG